MIDAEVAAPAAPPEATPAPVAPVLDCRQRESCRSEGRCTAQDDRCVAGSDQDCATSRRCLERGLCSRAGDECVAASHADCASSEVCEQLGRCISMQGRCAIATNLNCRQSEQCAEEGLCTAEGRSCVAAVRSQCTASRGCAEEGLCTAEDGVCIAVTRRDCRRSRACAEQGRCHRFEGRCVDTTEDNSPALMVTGVVITAIGGMGLVVAGVLLTNPSGQKCSGNGGIPSCFPSDVVAGVIMVPASLLVGAVGGILWGVGEIDVPVAPEPTGVPRVSLGPTGGSLAWSF